MRRDKQIADVDYEKGWAMMARMESVWMLIAIDAAMDWDMSQWDFSQAYLNGRLPDDPPVYMHQPKRFAKQREESKICKLFLPLYGMVQASHIWYFVLLMFFIELRFISSRADPCICFRHWNGEHTITTTHTDDVLAFFTSKEELTCVFDEFKNQYEITDVSENGLIVRLSIGHLPSGDISILQKAYIVKVLKHFDLWNLPPLNTPLPPGAWVVAQGKNDALTSEEINFIVDKPYCTLLRVFQWVACHTHWNLSFACSEFSRVQNNPAPEHWELLVEMYRYVCGTLNYGLLYSKMATEVPIQPISWTDSDWGGCVITQRSISDMVFTMFGTPI